MLRSTFRMLVPVVCALFLWSPTPAKATSKKVKRLIHWLQKGNAKQKTNAVRKLSKMGKKAKPAIAHVAVMLVTGPKSAHPFVVRTLLNVGEDSIGALYPIYKTRAYRAKKTVTKVLGRIGPKVSDKMVVSLLKILSERKGKYHSELTKTLIALGPTLVPKVEKHINAKWCSMMGHFGIARAALNWGPKGHALARRMLKNKDMYVRRATASVCQEDGEDSAPVVRALAELRKDKDHDTRFYAVWAISKQKPEVIVTVLKELFEAMDDKKRTVRRKAREAISKAGSKAFPRLRKLMRSENSDVRRRAATVAYWMDKKAAPLTPALIRLLTDKVAAVRLRALMALAEIGPKAKKSLKHIARLMKREDRISQNSAAITAFRKIGSGTEQQRRVIRRYLNHSQLLLRVNAYRTLAQWQDRKSIPAFIRGLKDKHQLVRRRALIALKVLKVTKAVPQIRPLLKDKHILVRVLAIKTLGSFGKKAKSALGDLERMLKDREHRTIRHHLRKAISQIK